MTPARPMPVDMTIATASSEWLPSFFLMISMEKAATIHTAIAPTIGLNPRRRPSATPASDEWERASPMRERRLWTMTVPRQATITDRRRPTRRALCIYAY